MSETISPSLEDRIQDSGGALSLLRGPGQLGSYAFPGIPAEFTNWRAEVRAWKSGVALLEQSFHMSEVQLHGPDSLKLLSQVAVNSFDPFPVLKAKQLVVASPDGYLIGDAILFHEAPDHYRLVGAPFALDWVHYQAEISDAEVTASLDHNWSVYEHPRDVFRFQIQGAYALDLVREVVDGELPQVKFFSIAEVSIAGHSVRALRHGMAGTPGFEIYGPWEYQAQIRQRFAEAGAAYGLRQVGALAYSTNAQESGWMPLPLPAIYHGDQLRPYREWLTGLSLEGLGSLGGSQQGTRIEDFYVDPIEVGYGRLIDFDHEFIGREALLARAKNQRRQKVTLVWNDDDVSAVQHSALFGDSPGGQFIALPSPMYATWAADAVMLRGREVGFSQYMSYSANAGHILSHGIIDREQAEPGTELTLLWGEPDSVRDNVDPHQLREIRVRVAPSPYFRKEIASTG